LGASLPVHGSLAMEAQEAKLDDGLRTSSSLGTPSIQSIHYYYPSALDDGRLSPMAVDLVERLVMHSGRSSTFPKHGCGGLSLSTV
jgi:hypothetical protein